MWSHLKESFDELRRAAPGERFRRRYWAWRERQREPYLLTSLYVALGVLAVALGIVFSFWPIVPGFVFVLGGLALVSARSEWAAYRLDRIELAGRRWLSRYWPRVRRTRLGRRRRERAAGRSSSEAGIGRD